MKKILFAVALVLLVAAWRGFTAENGEPEWPNGYMENEEPFDRVALGEDNFRIEVWRRSEGSDVWYFALVPGRATFFNWKDTGSFCVKIRAVTVSDPPQPLSPFSAETCDSQRPGRSGSTVVKP